MGSPIAKLTPVPKIAAAWRRLTGSHGSSSTSNNSNKNAPSQPPQQQQQQQAVPSSSSSSADYGGGGGGGPSLNPDVTFLDPPVRPLSAGLSALGPAAAALPAGVVTTPPSPSRQSSSSHHQQQQQLPLTPTQRRLSRVTSNTTTTTTTGRAPSLLGLAAQRAAFERQSGVAAAAQTAHALASAEMNLSSVESFMAGLSQCSPVVLGNAPSGMLRAIFDALNSAELLSRTAVVAVASSGQSQQQQVQQLQHRLAAVHAGRPMWDARAAIAILLLQQQQQQQQLPKNGGERSQRHQIDASFISSLLTDCDPRVRRHASSFVLTRFSQRHGQQYRAAVREVVAKAQRGDDERLLRSPEAQVMGMLEGRLLTLESIV